MITIMLTLELQILIERKNYLLNQRSLTVPKGSLAFCKRQLGREMFAGACPTGCCRSTQDFRNRRWRRTDCESSAAAAEGGGRLQTLLSTLLPQLQ